MYTKYVPAATETRKDSSSHETGLIGNCKSLDVDAENQTKVLCKSRECY